MGNEATRKQIRDWIEEQIKEARNPDPRKLMKKQREQRKAKVEKNYGL